MEIWQVIWNDPEGNEKRQEFPTYLEAWDFNRQDLDGKGEVVVLVDRLAGADTHRSESEAVRRIEGRGPRRRT